MIDITPLQEAQRKKKRLIRLLASSQKDKTALLKAVRGLQRQQTRGVISNDAFVIRQDALLGTRTLGEWKQHYDDTTYAIMDKVAESEARITELKAQPAYKQMTAPIPVAIILTIVLMLAFFAIKPTIIGLVTLGESIDASDEIGMSFSDSMNFTWSPATMGDISSLSMSGVASIEGETIVKIYNNNVSYIIFNSTMAEAVDYPDMGTEIDNTAIATAMTIKTVDRENVSLDIDLIYKSGTPLDMEDNGVESTAGFIDFTIENTITDLDASHLCTVWSIGDSYDECYGDALCCDFTEVMRYEDVWDTPFEMYHGLGDAGLDNNVTAQVWYVDYNLSVPYSDIHASDIMQLPANFFFGGFSFENECVETCLLDGFDKENYTIEVFVNDARLDLSIFNYSMLLAEEIEENIQDKAEIGKAVKWTKIKRTGSPKELSLKIPHNALNFTIYKVDDNRTLLNASEIRVRENMTEKGLRTFMLEKEVEDIEDRIEDVKDKDNKITICDTSGKKENTRSVAIQALKAHLERGGYIGACGIGDPSLTEKIISLDAMKAELEGINDTIIVDYNSTEPEIVVTEPATQIEIEYYTPAPIVIERMITATTKEIIVSADEHYVNILTYTKLPKETEAERVHLFWIVNNSKIEMMNISKNDSNSNGLIDWIEWITPHLSNQTFVVEISAAPYEYNFSEGVFINTTFDGENVTLNTTGGNHYPTGYYESQVIDAGSPARWRELSWNASSPYGQALPDNGDSDNGVNMSNNKLLLHLDEESGILADSSGHNNDATNTDGIYSVSGRFDTAIGFNETGNLTVSAAGSLETEDVTIEFWFKPDEDYGPGDDVSLLKKYDYEISIDDGLMSFTHGGVVVNSTTSSWSTGDWYHVLATYDGSNHKIYINGEEEGSI